MAFTAFSKDMGVISALQDRPNASGLGAAALKAKFDEGGQALKDYLNLTLLPQLNNLEPELSANATHLLWRLAGSDEWAELLALTAIKGDTGERGPMGAGDMDKADYDTDGDGTVDDSERLGGRPASYYAAAADVPAEGTGCVGIDALNPGKAKPERVSAAVREITESTTLSPLHAGCLLSVNSAADITLTIPADADAAFPAGTEIEVYRRGTGAVTLNAAEGVTAECKAAVCTITDRYTGAALKKLAENVWAVQGNVG